MNEAGSSLIVYLAFLFPESFAFSHRGGAGVRVYVLGWGVLGRQLHNISTLCASVLNCEGVRL